MADMQPDLAGPRDALLTTDSVEQFTEQLKSSVASRSLIDQAIGVIMATEHCSQDRAFALLRGISQNTNVKLRDLAADIVTNASGEPPRPTTPFEDG
jgi:AmiR/NasT family two-component response regulator